MTIREEAATNLDEWATSPVLSDLIGMLCGEQIGAGVDRVVYVHGLDEDLVVKVETKPSRRFQNVAEWQTWQAAVEEGDDVSRWLARCVSISENGIVLIQRRTKPVAIEDLPPKLPRFLGDLKRGNFGSVGGRVVAHDYGFPLFSFPMRMIRADWRDVD